MAGPSASDTIIVITGGDAIDPVILGELPDGALVVAADSGVERAQALGLRVDVAVGDFDSVSPSALEAAGAAGAAIERHPAAKDATDMELALEAAVARGARHIVVLGGHGGRLDHLLANALLLASPRWAEVTVVAHMGAARVTVVRGRAELAGRRGDLVSVIAPHGVAGGVTTEGLLYPLRAESLLPGSTRGISNELTGPAAAIEVASGVVLAIQPGLSGIHQERKPLT